ncbi:MAG: ATP-binding cassette domain-containing protein [Gulosibacter sp.]|uniref:ATP-binding cassette domain-containing protein n=1 Tax=Gulosibacter sp. TaxID=2817531 RepID=UPI003F927909
MAKKPVHAPAISVVDLRKSFRTNRVIDGLSFAVASGSIFALLGANGAGKTTTINILTTLVAADGGRAEVLGHDVSSAPDAVKRRIGVTGQSAAVDDVLTGFENITMFARLRGLKGRDARARATELLTEFGLTGAASRQVGTYSGGMRRRLDLALSFVVRPEVLFLDEPTTGLDARSRQDLWHVIRQLAASGTTVLLTTQYLDEADQLADRIAVMNHGRIVAEGTPRELKDAVGATSLELTNDRGERLRHVQIDGTLTDTKRALDALDREGLRGTVSVRQPTLDDVFLALTATTESNHRIHSPQGTAR